MKKILTAMIFIALSTVSSNAIGLPNLSSFELTAGLASNQGVFGASALETNRDESNVVRTTDKTSGVFTDGYSSQFLELGIGTWFSVGYEHTPDSISTPQDTRSTGGDVASATGSTSVSVDFNDLNTTYVKINLPFMTGAYIKSGSVDVDLDIKESMAGGSTYKNVSTSGTMMGAGYQTYIGESNFGIRFEAAYLDLDNVTTDNGVSLTGGTPANGGRNQIDASNLEGLQGKLAVTYTLGKN